LYLKQFSGISQMAVGSSINVDFNFKNLLEGYHRALFFVRIIK